jgi:hypothetical protein
MKQAIDEAEAWQLLRVVCRVFGSNLPCYDAIIGQALNLEQRDSLKDLIVFFKSDIMMILLFVPDHDLSDEDFGKCQKALMDFLNAFEEVISENILDAKHDQLVSYASNISVRITRWKLFS